MFHSSRYKNHHIHLSYIDGRETIQTQIHAQDGSFRLAPHKTFIGAKRAITRQVARAAKEQTK